MAFQQPQRLQPASKVSYSTPTPPRLVSPTIPLQAQESAHPPHREWILFSPASAALSEARTVSTAQTPRTAGRSRLSELGSLDTGPVSERYYDEGVHEEDAETEDLDSLDDGLHAFHDPSIYGLPRSTLDHSAEPVLPTHDGLGTFPGHNSSIQEQFWHHERHNPRRRFRSPRRASVQASFNVTGEERGNTLEEERFHRIEKWRMEQSRAILDEIEWETKRKRRRGTDVVRSDGKLTQVSESPILEAAKLQDTSPPPVIQEAETFLARITRRVIRDLMGFDEATLSIIFGESLADEFSEKEPVSEIVGCTKGTVLEETQSSEEAGSWKDRLLARIAKELGMIVSQLSEHPGAFSTYIRVQNAPSYAGLPHPRTSTAHQAETDRPTRTDLGTTPISEPHFTPTLAHRQISHNSITTDASLWGIEEETHDTVEEQTPDLAEIKEEREYWERDLDVNMVFGFLRNRLSASPRLASRPIPPNGCASSSQHDRRTAASSLRRAAMIRQHHPLVSRNVAAATNAPQIPQYVQPLKTAPPSQPLLRRRHSGIEGSVTSCATQSTKRSKTGKSGSSRNYWDVGAIRGGSLGSGGWGSAGWAEV